MILVIHHLIILTNKKPGLVNLGWDVCYLGWCLRKNHQVLVTPGGFRRYHPGDHPIVCQKNVRAGNPHRQCHWKTLSSLYIHVRYV